MGAKLYFYYSAMNAGKSAALLQSSHNYNERGMGTLLFVPKLLGTGRIASRIGLSAPATEFGPDFDFFAYLGARRGMSPSAAVEETSSTCSCVLVDEAQFMNKDQVRQLSRVADELQIPVLCYGLRTDFMGEPFEGSRYLLAWADCFTEIKAICECGKKATMNQRVTATGEPVAEGRQVEVGGNERYIGRCRRHFWEGIEGASAAARVDYLPPVDGAPSARGCEEEAPSTPEKTARRAASGAEAPGTLKKQVPRSFERELGIAAERAPVPEGFRPPPGLSAMPPDESPKPRLRTYSDPTTRAVHGSCRARAMSPLQLQRQLSEPAVAPEAFNFPILRHCR